MRPKVHIIIGGSPRPGRETLVERGDGKSGLAPLVVADSFKILLLSLTVKSWAFVTPRFDERVYPGEIAWRMEESA